MGLMQLFNFFAMSRSGNQAAKPIKKGPVRCRTGLRMFAGGTSWWAHLFGCAPILLVVIGAFAVFIDVEPFGFDFSGWTQANRVFER